MKIKLLLIIMFIANLGNAQAPWQAKFVVWFEGPNQTLVPDTVWFGCDSAATDGYQAELDVVADSFLFNKAYFVEDVLPGKYFKRNVKGFKKNEVIKFDFISKGKVRFIVWDSLEFKYLIDTMFMLYVEIEAGSHVSFDASHNNNMLLYLSPGSSQSGYYTNDSIDVLEGGGGLQFNINILFKDSSMFNSVPDINKQSPFCVKSGRDFFSVMNDKQIESMLSIYDVRGLMVKSLKISEIFTVINTSDFHEGIYLIHIQDVNKASFVFKYIKH